MPLTKVWNGTTGDFTLVTNWDRLSLRDGNFTWSASGSGTNEFYVERTGNTDPEIVAAPPTSGGIYINGSAATKGTVGTLAAGEWDYGDNDTLGYDTIYVRLADGTNPNTKAAGYVAMNQVPQTAEHVDIPEGAGAITSNTDYSGVAIGKFTVRRSNDNRAMGSVSNPLRLVCSGFVFEGGGQTPAYFDLTNSVIAPEIRSTASVDVDEFGLYLAAASVTVADLRGGSIGLGMLPGLPFVCSTGVRSRGSSVRCGIGSGSTVPLLEVLAGTVEHENSIANIEVDGGVVRSLLAAAVSGAVEVRQGTWYDQSTGTKAAVTAAGGNLDATQGGAKTWSSFTPNSGTLRDDPDTLTITAITRPTASGSFTWLKP